MENLAPIHINLTDREMAPTEQGPSRGLMSMVYENRLIALIIVLVVVLLVVLAYVFWKRDGGKPAERQSPYRRKQEPSAHEKIAGGTSKADLERERAELDSDSEEESEEETAFTSPSPPPPAPAQPRAKQIEQQAPPEKKEPPVDTDADEKLSLDNLDSQKQPPTDEQAPEVAKEPAAAGKKTCARCRMRINSDRTYCWRHEPGTS